MKTVIPAIPSAIFEHMVRMWADGTVNRESGSVFYYNKSDLLWRFRNLLDNRTLLTKYFGNRTIHIIDAETEPIEEMNELDEAIERKDGKPDDIYFITGVDSLLLRDNTSMFLSILSRDARLHEGSYLLFFTIDFTHPMFSRLFGSSTTVIQHIIFHPLHNTEETLQYIRHQSAVWNITLTDKTIYEIQKSCGGYYLFVKEAIRYLVQNPKAPVVEAIHHPEMQIRVKLVWDHFLDSEKEVFTNVILGKRNESEEQKHSLSFLTAVGYLSDKAVTLPLLSEFIKGLTYADGLFLSQNGVITYRGIPVGKQFPQKERALLTLLLQKKGTLVTRDDIVSSLSGDQPDADYSNWALDRLVSRLRKNIGALGVSPYIIQTIYGKGFQYAPKNT